MRSTILLLTLLLIGCASSPKVVHDIKEVSVPVGVKCVDTLPVPPKLHSDDEVKAMSDYDAIIAVLSDRIKQSIYAAELEAALAGCN